MVTKDHSNNGSGCVNETSGSYGSTGPVNRSAGRVRNSDSASSNGGVSGTEISPPPVSFGSLPSSFDPGTQIELSAAVAGVVPDGKCIWHSIIKQWYLAI